MVVLVDDVPLTEAQRALNEDDDLSRFVSLSAVLMQHPRIQQSAIHFLLGSIYGGDELSVSDNTCTLHGTTNNCVSPNPNSEAKHSLKLGDENDALYTSVGLRSRHRFPSRYRQGKLLHVQQREFACIDTDEFDFIGSREATTCVIAFLRY